MTTPPRSLEPTAAAQPLSFSYPSMVYDCRIGFVICLFTFRPILCCKGCMNTTTHQNLDIQGTINGYRKAAFSKLGVAV